MKKIIFLIILIILLITPSVFADENSDTEPEIIINKIEKSSQSRSNIQGLDLLSGDPENNPENYFLFESKGTKKKTIKLEDLNKNKQENLDLPQDAVIKLDTLQVDAKDAGIFDKIINVFDKEEQEQKSANLEIDISNQGKLNVKNTENITEQNQDEKIEIKYEYGEYKKAYQAEEVYLNIPELNFIDVDEKNINSLLEEIDDIELIDFFAEEIEIENATTTPEPEPVLEEEPIQIQEPIQNATSTDNATSTSLIAPKIFSQKPLKNYSFFDLLAGLIKPEQNKKGTKSYQIKMRSSTDTGNQTFQIIPDGSVYLYDGTELIAKAKPRFQYKSAGDWKNFEIEKIKIAKRLTNNLLTVLIKQETTTKNAIILKYEIGFNNNQFLKKQTWQINAPYKVRAVWEINTLPSSNSLDAKSKILQVNNLIIDASDYQGNTKISKETERAYVIFEPDGIRGPLTIDPSFSLVTTTDFVEIQTPDFQDQESDSGWRLRFSKLLGGTIDEFYHNKIQDGAINLINSSSSLPLFNISYQGDSLALNNAQLEILESSATRIRVKSTGSVNNDPVEIIYTVYLSGKINIESSINLQNISLHNRDGIFRFNLCHDQVSCSRQADDQNKLGLININNTLKTGLGVNQNGWIGDVDFTSNGLEFGASSAGVWAKGYTVTTNWLLDLDVVGALHATPLQEMQNIIQDFRNPDTLDFTIGQDQNGYHLTDGAYWMRAENNLAEFTMHGAEVNRYNPVFRLSNWTNGTLAAVYSELAGEEIVQDIDYILSFQDNDPDTQVLIFQFLGIVEDDLVFYIDPLCTSSDDGDWSDASKWDCVSAPGSGDQALIQHAITIDASVTVQDVTINTGGKLDFDTSGDGFILQINESGTDAKFTVGAADSAGELECRSPATADHTHTIKLNSVTAAASVGIEVLSQGNLDIQGTSTADQDCVITYGGTSNGYIYLLDGSLTTIKYAEISYMGANAANKYGITGATDIDGSASSEGIFIEGSNIHDVYAGIYLDQNCDYNIIKDNSISNTSSSVIKTLLADRNIIVGNNVTGAAGMSLRGAENLIANNSIYNITNSGAIGISLSGSGASNNTIRGNIIRIGTGQGGYPKGIFIGNSLNVVSNYIYNNTIDTADTRGIDLDDGSGHIVKNNIISNASTGIVDSASSTIDYNLFESNSSDGATGTNAIIDPGLTYVSTTGGNADFMYVNSDSPALAAGIGIFENDATPCGSGNDTACVNVGGRLGYVYNTTDTEEFNWLQQAHDDANLDAGDTVTTYANDIVSDTIVDNITAVGSYFVKFDVAEATVVADNDHEGMYAYFTSGANRGRYYLITDSDENTTDTLTIYSPDQASATFTAGDGFTVVDRVYARDSGRSGGSENLYLTKDGTATAPITWDTSGTVIVDAEDARNHAIGGYEHRYNIIDSFIVQNGLANGISGSDTAKIVNNTACFNGSGTGYQGGIYASSGNYVAVIQNNTSFSNNGYGISFTNYNRYVLDNTCYDNTTAGIYARSDWNVIKDNSTFSNGIGIRGYESDYDTVIGNRIFSNTGNGISLSTSRLYIYNNVINDNRGDGMYLHGPENIAKNNIITNQLGSGKKGINDLSTASTLTYNLYNNNTLDGDGTDGAGVVTDDPSFNFEVAATTDVESGTTTTIYDSSEIWTENEWIGYGVYLQDGGGTCGEAGWYGVTSNTTNRLFLAPAAATAIDSDCDYGVTNFYVSEDSGALGAGADLIAGTSDTSVNIGARLGLAKNDNDGTEREYNWLQQAHDDADLSAGDTVTVYAKDYATGEVSSVADDGAYITITAAAEVIGTSNNYEGMYLYFSDGRKKGNYYLIIDTASVAGPADTISVYTDAVTDINAGDDFTIVDRVYARDSGKNVACDGAGRGNHNLCLVEDGDSGGASPITWTTSGTVILDAENTRTQGAIYFFHADHNVINGFVMTGGTAGGRNAYLYSSDYNVFSNNILVESTQYGLDIKNSTYNIISNNTIFNNTVRGINTDGDHNSAYLNNIIYGNSNLGTYFYDNSNVIITGNKSFSNTGYGLGMHGDVDVVVTNNISFDNSASGIYINSAVSTSTVFNNNLSVDNAEGIDIRAGSGVIYNNIAAYNTDDGLDKLDADYTNDFNDLYGNSGADYDGVGSQGGNSVNTDPTFYAYASATASSGSTSTLTDSGIGWTADAWVGYTVWIHTGTSSGDFRYILSNTTDTLVIAGTFTSQIDATSDYKIIDFTIESEDALGGGAWLYAGDNSITAGGDSDDAGNYKPVNMGAHLGFVYNDDAGGTPVESNTLQQTSDDSELDGGDTLTVYTTDYRSSGTITSVSDDGPYLTFEVTDGTIGTNDDYIGFYLYITDGDNLNNYYLIIDSVAATPDTISIYTAQDNSFTSDTFAITDRIYTEQSHASANFSIANPGTSGTIVWDPSGTVVIDAENERDNNIYVDVNPDAYVRLRISDSFNFLNFNSSAIGGDAYADYSAGYYRWGVAITSATGTWDWSSTDADQPWPYGMRPQGGDTVILPNSAEITYDLEDGTIGENIADSDALTIQAGGKLIVGGDSSQNRELLLSAGNIRIYGDLEIRAVNGYISTIKLNPAASGDFGIIVESGGLLDMSGIAATHNVSITSNNQDGNHNPYLYLKNGSQTFIRNAELSYLGANIAGKYGIYAENVDFGTNEGLVITDSKINNNYHGVKLSSSTGAVLHNNLIYDNTNLGIYLNGSSNNTVYSNIIDNSASHNLSLVNGDSNNIYNNTIYDAGDDGIYLDSSSNSNIIRNNIIVNSASQAIDDSGSNTKSNNLTSDPGLTQATDPTHADYMYLSEDSGGLGTGANLITGISDTSVNIGARLGLAISDNKYNWLQQAGDDASMSKADTITVYAKDYVTTGLINQTPTDNGPYITLTVNNIIATDNNYEGMYLYFSDGRSNGKYYLIIDAQDEASDTISIYTDSATDINAGDDFVITDRIYSKLGSNNSNLYLDTDGDNDEPITWTNFGSVIIDAQDVQNYGIYLADADYNIISNFIIANALIDNIYLNASGNNKLNSLTLFSALGDGIELASTSENNILDTNNIFSSGEAGIEISSGTNNAVKSNIIYANTGDGILASTNSNNIQDNKLYNNTQEGINIAGTNNIIYHNILAHSGSDGINISANTNQIYQNTTLASAAYGVNLASTSSNIVRNNILRSDASGDISDSGSNTKSNNFNTDPSFFAYASGTADASGNTTTTLKDSDASPTWVADQWAGKAVLLTASNIYRYILSNTTDTLIIASTWTAPDSNAYEIIDFTLDAVANASDNAQGGGAYIYDGSSITAGNKPDPETISMGAYPDYVSNNNGGSAREMSNFQSAQSDSETTAGDTLAIYAVNYNTGTVSSALDSGPYTTLTLSTVNTISGDDDYIGFYAYMTGGTNSGNYYLILDSDDSSNTLSIYTDDATDFAEDDTLIITDRIYNTKGWDNGSKSANIRFIKDGSVGLPITYNANGTVIFDAQDLDYAFYLDADTGTNGIAYNNFQASGDDFIFSNVTNSATLYQGGIGVNLDSSIVHNNVNWAGTTDLTNTLFSGTFTSAVLDMGQENPTYSTITWSEENITTDVSDIRIKLRSHDDNTDILSETFVGAYTTPSGEDIDISHNNKQYIQYYADFLTTTTATLPKLNYLSISQEAEFTSSWFNTGSAEVTLSNLWWDETDGAGCDSPCLPAGADVEFRIRTAPDTGDSLPDTGSQTNWCGPDDATPDSCTSTTYFTDSTGATENFDDILIDSTDDQWVQYQIKFTQTADNKPYVDEVSVQYVINYPPTVTIESTYQDDISDSNPGQVTIEYNISDEEEGDSDPPSPDEGTVVTTLLYDIGVTIPSQISNSATIITVSNANLLPDATAENPKIILIDNELMTYTGKSINDLTGVTRAYSEESYGTTKSVAHSLGTTVWAKAITVSGDTGTILGIGDVPSETKIIIWSPATDVSGVEEDGFQIKVIANDGNASNQVGAGSSGIADFDTKAPVNGAIPIKIDANNATLYQATLTLSASDLNSMQMLICNDSNFSGCTWAEDAVDYAGTYTWTTETDPDTVYVKFRDNKNNAQTSGVSATTPETPTEFRVVDVSNVGISNYQMFLSWQVAQSGTDPAFYKYHVYRKLDSDSDIPGNWTDLTLVDSEDRELNYHTDQSVSFNINYDYYIVIEDEDNNVSYRSEVCNQANPNGVSDGCEGGGGASSEDTTPPEIYNISEGTPSNSQITISFDSHDNSGQIRDAKINYYKYNGTDNYSALNLDLSEGIPTLFNASSTTPHSYEITLNNLDANSYYYYQISMRDGVAGNLGTNDSSGSGHSFNTSNDPGPLIYAVQAIPSTTSAQVEWVTNESANSQVRYSSTDPLLETYSETILNTDMKTEHSETLDSLSTDTTYYYQVVSVDAALNSSASSIYNFSTSDTTAPEISSIETKAYTHNTATITFTTNEPSKSYVDYIASDTTPPSYTTTSSNTSYNTNHIHYLENLTAEQSYYYRVRASDSSDASDDTTDDNSGAGYNFTTNSEPQTTISNIQVEVSTTSAVITWDTNEDLSSQVVYSTDSELASPTSYPESPSNSTQSHSVEITSLSESIRYYYKVVSGAYESPIYNFVTGDETAPEITEVSVIANNNSAVVTWTTDESATSKVVYGPTTSYGFNSNKFETLVTSHAVTLTELQPGTTYYYKVISEDGAENETEDDNSGASYTFATTASQSGSGAEDGGDEPDDLAIVDGSISVVYTNTSAVITWDTNRLSTTKLNYGTTSNYGSESEDPTLTRQHAVSLTELNASTQYHYQVVSEIPSESEIVSSADQTFTTNAGTAVASSGGGGGSARDRTPPKITNFTIESITNTSAKFSWQTNEESVTILTYGKEEISDLVGVESSIDDKVKAHNVAIGLLNPGTTYQTQAVAIDKSGNVSHGTITNFTTTGKKIEVEDLTSEEGKKLLSEEFEEFISKMEVYLGPPIITDLGIVNIGPNQATIVWKTTVPTASVLDYGFSGDYGYSKRYLQFDQDHEIMLTELAPSTLYHFRVKGVTEEGQIVATEDLTFKTTEIPEIKNFVINQIKENSAIATWSTNIPSTSEVEITQVSNGEKNIQGISQLKYDHKLLITELKGETRYSVRVYAQDISANILTSEPAYFTTSIDRQPPIISRVKTESALAPTGTNVQIIISWTTDEPSTGQVFYDQGVKRDKELATSTGLDSNYTTNHIFVFTSFKPGFVYQFKVESVDASGNKAVSQDYTILTPRQQENIIDIIVENFEELFGFMKSGN